MPAGRKPLKTGKQGRAQGARAARSASRVGQRAWRWQPTRGYDPALLYVSLAKPPPRVAGARARARRLGRGMRRRAVQGRDRDRVSFRAAAAVRVEVAG